MRRRRRKTGSVGRSEAAAISKKLCKEMAESRGKVGYASEVGRL